MIHRHPGQSMLRYVKPAMRTGFALAVVASAMLSTLAIPAARASIDPTMPPDPACVPTFTVHAAPHYSAVQRVHHATAPVSSTRQVAHALGAHPRHHARIHHVETHHAETSLRTHVVAAS